MDETQEPGAQEAEPWSPRRRWLAGIIVVLVLIGLFAFAPGPILRIIHTNSAHELVDRLPAERDMLLAKQDEFRAPLKKLDDPVRSWTEVGCSLVPRYSDGDGEQDVVMFYWQQCWLQAMELYPVPEGLTDGASVAAWLGGHTAGDPTCGELLFDVLTPEAGAVGPHEYTPVLWWVDPDGTPPEDEPDRCALAAPGGPHTAHVTVDVDEPMTAESYLVYTVRTPFAATRVGCDNAMSSWLGGCVGEPDGFPVM
ncbi:hypothetical protein FVO59_14170 [Microbacterium esteraromaticum]|uniref:Uncharacterized protein n=1 Tax=Microbacterium esteraromaticum TaxID=57043 RepID=A0A7D8AKN9_9MICO|nr:hypothetical protein [Microbacterium esteraromaticum]QMU98205.1 hypothetical protein FVO59_14170 [Microbacterium esteraromaticum]